MTSKISENCFLDLPADTASAAGISAKGYQKIRAFPNPAIDMFDWYLHWESLHNAIISLRDLQEKISMSKETKDNLSNHGHVKLADLAQGLYMLSVETEEKRQSQQLSLQTNCF